MKSTFLTLFCAIIQVITLIWYVYVLPTTFVDKHLKDNLPCYMFSIQDYFPINDEYLGNFRYIVSYIPGGTAGMKMMSRFFSSAAMKTVSKTLPV